MRDKAEPPPSASVLYAEKGRSSVLAWGGMMSGHRQHRRSQARCRGFSLVELVIVVVIIGIVAAIAAPRMTGASTAASASALRATLMGVRTAIDCYFAEHGRYPGHLPATDTPDNDAFVEQVTRYSDGAGKTNPTPSNLYVFGPYLRRPFPVNPANGLSTVFVKAVPGDADPAAGTFGWVAVFSHGYFGISATNAQLDKMGVTKLEDQQAVRAK